MRSRTTCGIRFTASQEASSIAHFLNNLGLERFGPYEQLNGKAQWRCTARVRRFARWPAASDRGKNPPRLMGRRGGNRTLFQ
ncbi:hypothetical protein D9M68_480190 [compost metagenome]